MSNTEDQDHDISEEMVAAAVQQQTLEVAAMLQVFTTLSEPKRMELARIVAEEQMAIAKNIFPTLNDPESIRRYPTLAVNITNAKTGVTGQVAVRKHISMCEEDPGLALNHAFVLGLTLSPLPRALLRAFGYTYTFAQMASTVQNPSKPKIITV